MAARRLGGSGRWKPPSPSRDVCVWGKRVRALLEGRRVVRSREPNAGGPRLGPAGATPPSPSRSRRLSRRTPAVAPRHSPASQAVYVLVFQWHRGNCAEGKEAVRDGRAVKETPIPHLSDLRARATSSTRSRAIQTTATSKSSPDSILVKERREGGPAQLRAVNPSKERLAGTAIYCVRKNYSAFIARSRIKVSVHSPTASSSKLHPELNRLLECG